MDLQNPQSRTIFIMLLLGGILFLVVLVILILPDPAPEGDNTPTPIVTPYPTSEIIRKTPDNALIYKRNPNGKYIVESLDPTITDEEIRKQLKLKPEDTYEVVVPGPAIPTQESKDTEKTYEDIIRERFDLNPNHQE